MLPDTALAFLATPDVFRRAGRGSRVPLGSERNGRPTSIKLVLQAGRVRSAGRLLNRNYAPGATPSSATSSCGKHVRLRAREATVTVRGHRVPGARVRRSVECRPADPYAGSVVTHRRLAAPLPARTFSTSRSSNRPASNTLMARTLVTPTGAGAGRGLSVAGRSACPRCAGGLWRGPYTLPAARSGWPP